MSVLDTPHPFECLACGREFRMTATRLTNDV